MNRLFNKNTRMIPLCAVLATSLLVACSDDDDDDDGTAPVGGEMEMEMETDEGGGEGTDPMMGGEGSDGALTMEDLTGTWDTGCLLDDPEDVDSEYEQAEVEFDGTTFEYEGDSFSDAGCTLSLGEAVDIEGTFTLGAVVTTMDGIEATEIDITASEEGSDESVTILDLVHISNNSLFFANGDFGELDDLVGQPRPDSLELDEPFMLQPEE